MSQDRFSKLTEEEKAGLLKHMLRERGLPEDLEPQEAMRLLAMGHFQKVPEVEPRSPLERDVAAIVARAMGRMRISVYHPFDPVGMRLDEASLLEAIKHQCGVAMDHKTLHRAKTVAALAAAVEQLQKRKQVWPKISAADPDERILAPSQRRLWFFNKLEGPSPTHNLSRTLRLEGILNPQSFNKAMHNLFKRHDLFSQFYPTVEGKPTIEQLDKAPSRLTLIDLSHLDDNEVLAQDLSNRLTRIPFKIESAPSIRIILIRLDLQVHLLHVGLHRIAADAMTLDLILASLASDYRKYQAGKTPNSDPAKLQYRDFASWQVKRVDDFWARSEQFWVDQLKNAPELHQIPLSYPRPVRQSFRASHINFRIGRKLTKELNGLSQIEGTTLEALCLTAYATFVHRYSHANDIMIGTPFSLRGHKQLRTLPGPLSNTLAIRVTFQSNPDFMTLLHRTRATVSNAILHAILPFDRVVKLLGSGRDLSHAPLFQLHVGFGHATPELQVPGISVSETARSQNFTRYDISLQIEPHDDQLRAKFVYNSQLFSQKRADQMVRHFKILLRGIARHHDQPVSTINILSEEERETILIDWNTTAINLGPRLCIHDLFQRQVNKTPDQTALIFSNSEGGSLSYRALNQRANAIAHDLIEMGVRPETTIGVACERTPAMVMAVLGVLKSGAAFLPLDAGYPMERLDYMLAEVKAPILIVDEELVGRFAPFKGKRIVVNAMGIPKERLSQRDDDPVGLVRDMHRAYVMFTSGSEGYPKGVVATHRGMVNRLYWARDVFPLKRDDRFMMLATLSFDIAFWEMMAPLITGASLVLAPQDAHKDVTQIAQLIADFEVSVVHFIPSLFHAFLQGPRVEATRPFLKRVFCGGESLSQATLKAAYDKLEARIIHFYGPTETTVNVTAAWCRPDLQRVAIGRPIANTSAYVLDEQLQPVPMGVAGVLYIGGVPLARGYESRPGLTAKQFIPNPFAGEQPFAGAGSRLYHTGDRVCLGPGGDIHFLGRFDRRVKIHGHRIELGEIEKTILGHESVSEAAVLAMQFGEKGSDRVVVYVQLRKGHKSSSRAIKHWLGRRLPEYMIPAAVVFLETMPLLPNGKIDRRRLPHPKKDQLSQSTRYVAPRNREEHLLSVIWADVLGLKKVGIHDHFFELGGDSMLIITMEARAAQAGVHIHPRQIFERPTIAELVAAINEEPELYIPKSLTVHAALKEKAALRGDSPAFLDSRGNCLLTYANLDNHSNEIATRLVSIGIRVGDVIAICAHHPKDLILGMLATMKCGATALMIHPDRSRRQKFQMTQRARTVAALIDTSENLPDFTGPAFLINPGLQPVPYFEGPAIDGSHIALISYRFNPSGHEIATMMTHHNLIAMIWGVIAVPSLKPDDMTLYPYPSLVYLSITEFLVPLLAGAQVMVGESDILCDASALNRHLLQHSVSLIRVSEAMLPALTSAVRGGTADLKLLCASDIADSTAAQLRKRYRRTWFLKGMPETSYICAWGQLEESEEGSHEVGLNGPIHNAFLYVLDENLRFVPPGVMGELYVGGDILTIGYLDSPTHTAAKFIPDPFTRGSVGARLFRSGKRGFYMSDGRIILQ